ncbi:21288_t:CDS:2, partial [Gigaspora rosea]
NITTLFKLSGTTRYETNAAIVDTLKKNFIKAIEKDNWDDEKFKIFLTKSMKYFFIEELRPIIFALLKKYPKRMTEEIYEILHKSCQETGYYT